jgi:hypothetical protein
MMVTVLKPNNAGTNTFLQDIEHTGGRIAKRLDVLKVSSKNKLSDLFITVIEAYPTGENPTIKPSVISSKDGNILSLTSKKGTRKFKILADRNDKNTPLLIDLNSKSSGKK